MSAVLTLGWQAALPFCAPGLDVPGAGEMGGGGGGAWTWRKGAASRQVLAQELVGVGACRKGPDSLTFCLSLSGSPLSSSPMWGVSAMPLPQEIAGLGWRPEQGAKAGSEGFQGC